jgi:hypothetical protein
VALRDEIVDRGLATTRHATQHVVVVVLPARFLPRHA